MITDKQVKEMISQASSGRTDLRSDGSYILTFDQIRSLLEIHTVTEEAEVKVTKPDIDSQRRPRHDRYYLREVIAWDVGNGNIGVIHNEVMAKPVAVVQKSYFDERHWRSIDPFGDVLDSLPSGTILYAKIS